MHERGSMSNTNKQKTKPEQNKTQMIEMIGWQRILENRSIGRLALSFFVGVPVEETREPVGHGATQC